MLNESSPFVLALRADDQKLLGYNLDQDELVRLPAGLNFQKVFIC